MNKIKMKTNMKGHKMKLGGGINRRKFLTAVTVMAATPWLSHRLWAAGERELPAGPAVGKHRKLGSLEVSSVGLGCQDLTGTFYATSPNRSDMIKLIQKAYDQGVTFF